MNYRGLATRYTSEQNKNMNIKKIIQDRSILLLISQIYQIKLRKPLPFWFFLIKFKRPRNSIILQTPEKSGQACHPSYTEMDGKEYLAYTPYPFSNDFYENPCVSYRSDTNSFWEALGDKSGLVAVPENRNSYHYSDPYLYAKADHSLGLIFRKTNRKNALENYFLFTEFFDGKWSDPIEIYFSQNDLIVSPCVFNKDINCLLFVFYSNDTSVIRYKNYNDEHDLAVSNFPEDWIIWHFDVFSLNTQKYLILCIKQGDKYKVATCIFDDSKLLLYDFKVQTLLPSEDIVSPYKATYIRQEDNGICLFYLSAMNKRHRWYIYEWRIPINDI